MRINYVQLGNQFCSAFLSVGRACRISLHTCACLWPEDSIFSNQESASRKGSVENWYCLRCNRELDDAHKSIAIVLFAQTMGPQPRQKSAARRVCFCPQCSVSLAMGPPTEGPAALHVAAARHLLEFSLQRPILVSSTAEIC